ncbi:metallophosphoesterase [Sphingopyxis sp. BSN-002]|uniref:metallophosphoesterase n=1 Tax=Sphingopyxis sp. BSN-002 TaxID=2911495 RepID=UPI001EDB0025|nr:metallophosphoesterase [Sphingopyxis sp. BSN-002]UKK84327.1 metallophosphoesterase [Sphingopyxis sp. BSN-002]
MSDKLRRKWRRWIALLILLGLAFIGRGFWNATRDPIVRTASVAVADWPTGQAPIKVLLISDVHVSTPDMSPARLTRLVGQLNELKPDLVVIAGDLISGKRFATRHHTPDEIAAPLAGFHARFGTVAVLGNHDFWHDAPAQAAALQNRGIVVLANNAIRRGPLIVGGVADEVTRHDDIPGTYAAMDALGAGPRVLLTHSPDVVPKLPAPVAAVLTGHTHCGQLVFPLIGALTYASRYHDRFACGDIRDGKQRVFVGAGLGTSILPLRYGAPPDVWLVTLGPGK